MSLAKLMTSVLMDREMDMPRPLRIRLRPLALKSADMPVYSLSDCLLILMDGTDGEVSLFDGFYTAGFDGDVFESDYTRIEGIRDGDLQVTMKKDQPIWPEKTGTDTAEDLNGDRWLLLDGVWQIMARR